LRSLPDIRAALKQVQRSCPRKDCENSIYEQAG
jgi:hypothetical protein